MNKVTTSSDFPRALRPLPSSAQFEELSRAGLTESQGVPTRPFRCKVGQVSPLRKSGNDQGWPRSGRSQVWDEPAPQNPQSRVCRFRPWDAVSCHGFLALPHVPETAATWFRRSGSCEPMIQDSASPTDLTGIAFLCRPDVTFDM